MTKVIDENIWTVDGPDIVFAGASMHTRMTVIRLADDRLWVHSPIELSDEVREFVDGLGGEVAALIAPNKFHYLFVEPWQAAFPEAHLFAEQELLQKVPTLANAEVLTDTTPELYSDDIDQVIFGGNRLFEEVVFFHKSSSSLIFTDLILNLKIDEATLPARVFYRFEGVVYPNGGVPRLYRWLTRNKSSGRAALEVIRAWQPRRLLFCHGEAFDASAEEILNREFAFLETR